MPSLPVSRVFGATAAAVRLLRLHIWGIVVLAAVAVFVALAAHVVDLPGVYYDELFEVVPSLAFVKGGLASTVAEIPKTQVWILGHPLPLMAQPYNGGLKTILFIPVAALFGITAASVRYFTIAVAGASLFVYYLFARRLFVHPAVGGIAVVLLAFDPSFVFFSRVDYGPSVVMFLCKAIALWQLAAWWQTERMRHLLIGSFAFGLGVYDKTNFLWIVAATLFAAAIVRPRELLARLDRTRVAAALGAFLLGSLPLVIYNISWPPRTLAPIRAGTTHLKYGNYHGNFFAQLFERGRELARLLDGESASHFFGYDVFPRVPLLPVYLALAALAVMVLYLRRVSRPRTRPAMFVLLSCVGILVAAALTPGGDKPHHLLLAYPFPQLLVAAAAVEGLFLMKLRARSQRIRVLLVTLLACAIGIPPAVGGLQVRHIQKRFEATGGGRGNLSDAIYRLDDYLLKHDSQRHIVILDWGIYFNLVGLSQGKLDCAQVWLELKKGGPAAKPILGELARPSYRYILHSPAATNFIEPRDTFFAVVRRHHLRARLERRIRSREGLPVFELYRLERRAA